MQHVGKPRFPRHGDESRFFSIRRAAGVQFTVLLLCCCFGVVSNLRADQNAVTSSEVPTVQLRVKTVKVRLIEGTEISFRHLPNTAGLYQTRVEQIAQDDDGFMWFGTQSGLNRFDGYKCKVFKHDPTRPGSLSGVLIQSLFKDRSGALWVGSDQYVDRFDPATETFSRLRLGSTNPEKPMNFHFISQDSAGVVWLPNGNGLYGLNPANNHLFYYRHDPHDPASLSNSEAISVSEDRSGFFWIGTRVGLDQFDRASGKVRLHILLDDSGLGLRIHEDRFGIFWIIYGDGILGVLDWKNNRLTRYSFEPVNGSAKTSGSVSPMLEDRDGTMWFGTNGNGLLKYDREQQRFISYNMHPGDPESLSDTRVIALFQDREGNIWAGLHQAEPTFFNPHPPPFQKFTFQRGNPNSLGSALVSVIHEDHEGGLWLGADRVLKRLDRKTGQYSTFDGITGHEVLSIVEQGPDVLWFGTAGLGLKRYDLRTKRLKTYWNTPGDTSTLCGNFVAKLLIDRKGRLWAANWGGLCYLDFKTDRFATFPIDRVGLNYHAIVEDAHGVMWLGSELGLQRLDPTTGRLMVFQHSDAPDSLSDNRVNSVYFDGRGTLWVGTQNGLDKFNPQTSRFTHFNQRNGMAGNVVSCILEDNQRRLWMSTNNGISRFNPVDKSFDNYSVADGLPGPDLTGWGACFKSDSGEMFFGGFSGATAFHPDKVANSTYVPPIVLTDFQLFGVPVTLGHGSPLTRSITHTNAISLSNDQNIFSIGFSALSYSNAFTNRFRYKLEPLQRQWTEVGSDQRFASYTTLPTGIYTFHVQGATSRGPWSEPGVAVGIEILPPWWSTWAFRTLLCAVVLLLVWFGYRYRLHQLTHQYNVRLEERVGERTRIARELHDTLLQGFQGLMFRLQAVRDLLPDHPVQAIEALDTALDRGDDAIGEARDAVQGLRASATLDDDLAQGLTSLGEEFAATNGSRDAAVFRLLVEGHPRVVTANLRDDIYSIAREALGNAFRHAHAQNIEAEVTFGDELFILRVRDNGRGIDQSVLDRGHRAGHWGLNGMRERAEVIGGTLEVWSQHAAGTEVALTIPASVAYARSVVRPAFALIRKKAEQNGH